MYPPIKKELSYNERESFKSGKAMPPIKIRTSNTEELIKKINIVDGLF